MSVATSFRSEHVQETCVHLRTSRRLPPRLSLPREAERKQEAMQVIYERSCGLDVHKKTVVACVVITLPDGQVQKQVRTFATTTASLLALADWLAAFQISHVAMESSGIYWRP